MLLTVVTIIWGTTFVATRVLVADRADGPPQVSPAVLILARFGIAAALFAPFLRGGRATGRLWTVGLELGFWLWCSYGSLAVGLRYISASRGAFITALHVVFVPTMTALAGRRVGRVIWTAAAMATAGTLLLCHDGAEPGRGDAWTVVTAATYAVYIIRLERYAGRFPSRTLTAVQLLAVAALSAGWAAADVRASGIPHLPAAAVVSIVYLGVVATAVTTWLSTVGQQWVTGPQASLLYTMEPVWATAIAWVAADERFGPAGGVGAVMILSAAVLSQVRPRRKAEG